MPKIGSSESYGHVFEWFMDGARMAAVHDGKRTHIFNTDIETGHYPESSKALHYIKPELLGIEIEKDAFDSAEKMIIIPETVLKTRDLIRKNIMLDPKQFYYRTIHEAYMPFGLVEFKMFEDLLLMFFEGHDAAIPDEILQNTDEGIKVPADLIKGVPEIVLSMEVLAARDEIRKENEYRRNFKTLAVKNGCEFVLNGDTLIVKHGGKEAICTEIVQIYGRAAVNVESLGLDHPFVELPAEVEEAFRRVLGNKVPDGLELVSCGKSLLDGADYFKLSKPIPEELFNLVKLYFEYFGEASDNFCGWLTREPRRVADTLKIEF